MGMQVLQYTMGQIIILPQHQHLTVFMISKVYLREHIMLLQMMVAGVQVSPLLLLLTRQTHLHMVDML